MDEKGELIIPILRTKIILPKPHPETAPCLALEGRLRSALSGKLVLISAPQASCFLNRSRLPTCF